MRHGLLVVAVLAAGCASATPAPDPLARADREMAAARHGDAVQLYEEFLRANPEHPAAARARASQAALGRLITAEAEAERLRKDVSARDAEIAQLRRELAGRTTETAGRAAEVARLRRDLEARQAEVDRLKADLDRLRSIDLRREPSRR